MGRQQPQRRKMKTSDVLLLTHERKHEHVVKDMDCASEKVQNAKSCIPVTEYMESSWACGGSSVAINAGRRTVKSVPEQMVIEERKGRMDMLSLLLLLHDHMRLPNCYLLISAGRHGNTTVPTVKCRGLSNVGKLESWTCIGNRLAGGTFSSLNARGP